MRKEQASKRGPIRAVLDVEGGFVIAETHKGKVVKLPASFEVKEESKFPEGTIESLFPVVQRALVNYPELIPQEKTYWDEIKEMASFSEEDAVNLVRKHENSVEDTTVELINRFMRLSGQDPSEVETGTKQTVYLLIKGEIHELYIETTEVNLSKTK